MRVRANKQIWRVAKYLHDNVYPEWEQAYDGFDGSDQSFRDQFYDWAAEFLKKLQNNEFTNGDNHGD